MRFVERSDPHAAERVALLRDLLEGGSWVSGRVIQSRMHRTFGSAFYSEALGVLRDEWGGVDFEDRNVGTQHHYWYRRHR